MGVNLSPGAAALKEVAHEPRGGGHGTGDLVLGPVAQALNATDVLPRQFIALLLLKS